MARLLRFECEIPDAVFDKEFPEDRFVQTLKEEAIIKLFKAERLSSDYAAKLLGITRRDFFDRLAQHGVGLASYTETDLEQSIGSGLIDCSTVDDVTNTSDTGPGCTFGGKTKRVSEL